MKSTQRPVNSNNGQSRPDGQSSSNNIQSGLDATIALVYPDGRVTNVKIGKK